MGFQGIDRVGPDLVYGIEVCLEHIRVLIIFGGDVLLDSSGHGDSIGPSKGEEEDIPGNYVRRVRMPYDIDEIHSRSHNFQLHPIQAALRAQ